MINHQAQQPKGNQLRRLLVLCHMICALIRSGKASLQSIGNEMETKADLESRIKQAKRWLNNKWTDTEVHFIPYILPILRSLSGGRELVLAIDGSCIGNGCMCLMLSVIWRKRAIPIIWLVRESPKGHFPEQMHIDLVEQASKLLQSIGDMPCKITLLGDGEFDGNQLQSCCLQKGWDYVLKTAKTTLIADNPDMNLSSKVGQLAPCNGSNHLMLHNMYITKDAFGPVNVLYWHDRKYKNPLYLLTNLEYAPDAEKYYRKRYCIETFFSDIKSRGFNIDKTKIANPDTLYNLLIVACLRSGYFSIVLKNL